MMTATRYTPRVGDVIEADGWRIGQTLDAGDDFVDSGFPGCQFRVWMGGGVFHVAVNVEVTGKPHYRGYGRCRSRCRIEFVGDCEPSTFTRGWLYHDA